MPKCWWWSWAGTKTSSGSTPFALSRYQIRFASLEQVSETIQVKSLKKAELWSGTKTGVQKLMVLRLTYNHCWKLKWLKDLFAPVNKLMDLLEVFDLGWVTETHKEVQKVKQHHINIPHSQLIRPKQTQAQLMHLIDYFSFSFFSEELWRAFA